MVDWVFVALVYVIIEIICVCAVLLLYCTERWCCK